MNEMTINGMLRLAGSHFGQNDANWLVIEVSVYGAKPEVIINRKENFQDKLNYYVEAYNNDLTLKANPNVQIVSYNMYENLMDWAKYKV